TASLGNGTPLVMIPATLGHIEAYLSIPEVRATIDSLAESYQFVTYDPRGRGLSDRDVSDWSLDVRLADVVAVFEGLSLPSSHVLARAFGSMIGIRLAAQYPQLVRRLGLYVGIVRGSDVPETVFLSEVDALRETDWTFYCKIVGLQYFDWTESGRLFADGLRRAFA